MRDLFDIKLAPYHNAPDARYSYGKQLTWVCGVVNVVCVLLDWSIYPR